VSPNFQAKKGHYLVAGTQLPLAIVQYFFGLGRRQRAEIAVSIWSSDGITQPIYRPIVLSEGPDRSRLMRRIEIPEIRNRKRNLAILFLKLKGRRRYVYLILPKEARSFITANRLLEKNGQQGNQERRYIIGKKGDSVWKSIITLLPK
jgi:hypothetical protein